MKRFVCLLLVAVMSVTLLCACNKSETESSQPATSGAQSETDSKYVDENGQYRPLAPAEKQNGRTFTIIVRGAIAGTYQSDDFTTDSEMYGDLLNNAVAERNNKVEELYGVELVVLKSDTINEDIRLDCASSLGSYDAIMPTLPFLSVLASEGYLLDLRTVEGFDLEAPWWDSNCTEAFSISNKVYFTTGDITILNKVCTPSILFNKPMITSYNLENPYDLVKEKKWTFEKMLEMARSVNKIVTPDGSYSKDNVYGMVSAYGDSISFYSASGEKICDKDSDDIPYLAIGASDRSVTIAQKVLTMMADEDFILFAQECEAPIWETSFEVFYGGRALFRPSGFSATTKARKWSEIEFGILPLPLMDSTQTEYCTACGSGEVAGVAIPVCAPDPEYSAYMLQAYAAYAKNYITHAYYDINLKYKDARDDESMEMLDIIFSNIKYDVGEVYDFGGIATMFYQLTQAKSTDITSSLDGKRSAAELAIDEVVEMYMNLE